MIRELAILMVLAGCGAVDGLAPAPPGTGGVAGKLDEVVGAPNEGEARPKPLPTEEEEESSPSGEEDFSDLDENADEGPTAEELAKQCGGIDLDDPDAVVLEQTLPGLPIVQRGTVIIVPYEVTVLGTLALKSTARQSVNSTSFDVRANPALAQGRAEQEVARLAGPVTTTFVEVGERAALVDRHESWEGILCVVQPAVRIENEVGGGSVVVSFDPPVPTSVSPKADAVRYDEEVPREIVWTNLMATVESSTNQTVTGGSTYTGTVTVRPIAPTLSHTLDDGTAVQITADRAYEVLVDFGGAQITNALGLKPKTQFFIDHKKRAFKAIKAETGLPDTPPAVFVSN